MTADGVNSYEWDAEYRLIQITYPGTSNNSQFVYDSWGRTARTVENVSGIPSTKQFVWNGYARHEERDASGTLSKSYFSLGQMNTTTKYFYAKDHLSSVREMTDIAADTQAAYSFSPFGNVSALQEIVSSDMGFCQYYLHQRSSLCLTLNRPYDPSRGRFISRDPIEQGENGYSYAANAPTLAVDPSGLQNILNSRGHQQLWGQEGFERLTGAKPGTYGMGCIAVVDFYLKIGPAVVPESNEGRPAGSEPADTHCFWGGSKDNPGDLTPAINAVCEYDKKNPCPKGTHRVIWCKQGYLNDNTRRGSPGSPVSNPAGIWNNSGGLFNYSVYFPETRTFAGANTSGGCNYISPQIPPGVVPNDVNGSMCCRSCVED